MKQLQITEETLIQQNRDIAAINIGDKKLTLWGREYEVPDGCDKGFGTNHPARAACNTCPLVIPCFCKKTGTPITPSRQLGKKVQRADTDKQRRKKSMTTDNTATPAAGTPAPTPVTAKAINPFKVGSKPHQTRELILEVAKRGIAKASTDELEKLFAELGLTRAKNREERPNLLNRQLQAYAVNPAKRGGPKAPSANHAPLHGLITVTGTKPNFEFAFNIEAIRSKLAELEAQGVQAPPAGAATPAAGAADSDDDDDDE